MAGGKLAKRSHSHTGRRMGRKTGQLESESQLDHSLHFHWILYDTTSRSLGFPTVDQHLLTTASAVLKIIHGVFLDTCVYVYVCVVCI